MPGTSFSTSNWGSYDEHSADISPSGALTDFSLLIDISNLSASFGSTVQSDGGDIRCTDESDNELPFDLIDWNYGGGSPIGFIRVKRSLSTSTSTQKVRVWYGYTPGTAVAYDANETYGQHNAYDDNWVGYWPLVEDANDRTSYSNHLTAVGGVTVGGGTGRFGAATVFDGIDDGFNKTFGVNEPPEFMGATAFTVVADAISTSRDTWDTILGYGTDATDLGIYLRQRGTSDDISVTQQADAMTEARGGSIETTIKHFVGTSDFVSGPEVFQDNVSVGTGSATSGNYQTFNDKRLDIGFNDGERYWTGTIANVQLHDVVRGADWRGLEYDQTEDNAAFWGTWTWSSGGGGGPTTTFTPKIMIWT